MYVSLIYIGNKHRPVLWVFGVTNYKETLFQSTENNERLLQNLFFRGKKKSATRLEIQSVLLALLSNSSTPEKLETIFQFAIFLPNTRNYV